LKVRQFYVVGRALPSEENPTPELYRMRVFGRDAVLARSKFWYHMKRQHKVRKVQGEIVSTSEIFEKHANSVKNYGIVFKYLTRTDTVNMYKEYRNTTLCGAMSNLYMEMAGRHSARAETLQVIRTSILPNKSLRRANVQQVAAVNAKFPKTDLRKRAPTRALRTTFKAERPTLI
jgi:large subunit ribosomal protein L18Ae